MLPFTGPASPLERKLLITSHLTSKPVPPPFPEPRWILSSALLPAPAGDENPQAFTGVRLNVNEDQMAHSDVLAWSLLGVLVLTLAMVGACVWGIYRQFRKASATADALEEAADETLPPEDPAPTPKKKPRAARSASWERPADWWKQPPVD